MGPVNGQGEQHEPSGEQPEIPDISVVLSAVPPGNLAVQTVVLGQHPVLMLQFNREPGEQHVTTADLVVGGVPQGDVQEFIHYVAGMLSHVQVGAWDDGTE